ncbi:ribosome biogenesis GTPase YlqF [Moraxellaceae bacterium AER2_44_116]|nr:ribosome biogenesis GTPase YlqF [Moraxellaceae bacterium]TQC99143.1 ribosome biogenesis GTPase YlqF [Moraxellaceae bacterium AER2_44_116]
MSINWFPGHMNKAIREIKELLPKVDLIIEVVDARIPFSSANPVIEQFRGNKPCIKLLNKSDLADPVVTELWLDYWQQQQGVKAIAVSSQRPEQIRSLVGLCKNILHGKENALGNLTAMITGIPNVGKSTIINILAGKVIAKTGNEPAITKGQQCINLHNGLLLYDTPGILWPKIENVQSGYRLAATGAIKETAMNNEDVAVFAVGYFLKTYPELLKQRFKLDELPETEIEFLDIVGKQRGCLGGGGHVDFHKIANIVLQEFRNIVIGRISMERPEDIEREMIIVQQLRDEKLAQQELNKKQRKKDFNTRNR